MATSFIKKNKTSFDFDSCLFFTGTPHRGKDYGFWALMRLVNPEVFSENKANAEQYIELKKYFIRNNKQYVTNMNGEKLFKPLNQSPMTFSYSKEESDFYNKMSEFIQNGQVYAMGLDGELKQQVQLVLITLQKIASSSICAIKSALQNRLEKFQEELKKINDKNQNDKASSDNNFLLKDFLPDETDYQNEQVLLFTEYKHTQALMVGALMKKFD